MFTDKPSPFRPRSDSGCTVTAIVVAVFVGFGLHTYVPRATVQNATNATGPSTAPPSAQRSAATHPAWNLTADVDRLQPTVPVASSPEPVARSPISPSARATIYFCKAYSGGTFWSDTTCSAQRATIDRMTTVPASLPFEQRVAIARGEAQEAAALYESPQPTRAAVIEAVAPANGRPSICDVYDQQVRDLDAEARRPLPASRQDQIRADRMNVLSARARERC